MSATAADARSRTVFDLFFGPRETRPPQQQYYPAPPRPAKPKRPAKPARTTTPSTLKTTAPAIPTELSLPIVEKKADARKILVIGDFISSGLAEGLGAAFSENPDVTVTSRANGSSGFVRNDYFDWPANIAKVLADESPAVVVVMIGANDRQAITYDNTSLTLRSDAWTSEYQSRVNAFIKTIKAGNYPLIWVGQPPFKPHGMSRDMLAFNEIYRIATEQAGGSFVDVWDGFIDESGNVALSGFDVKGQTARLRANDGINITSAGKRKLAFYAEKPLRKALDETGVKDGSLPAATADLPNEQRKAVDHIAPVSLRDLDMDTSGILLGGNIITASGQKAKDAGSTVPKPPYGRVDDFSWPRETATK